MTYRLTAEDVGWVTLAGSGIAFTTTRHDLKPDEVDTVDVMRPGDRRPTVVFTGPTGGDIEGLAAGKDYLVWTSDATVPDDPTVSIPWTMYAYDLRSGQTSIVASDRAGSPEPPWAFMHGDRIVWPQYQGLGTKLTDFYLMDLRRPRSRRKILSDVQAEQTAFNGTSVVYNETVVPSRSNSDLGKSDLFQLDLTTGATTRLTRTGEVEMPTISGRWLAWQAGHRLGMLNLKDRVVHRLHAALDGGFLTAGAGFATFLGEDGGLRLIKLAAGARPMEIPRTADSMCVPCGLDVSGRRVVWTLNPGLVDRKYIVHVAEVMG